MKQKIKLGIILGFEFVAITLILVLIFFAGKKTYTVTFDLNGGTLISGDLVQTVSQGKNATAPTVAKDGCYLHSWSTSYHKVTRDIVVKAIWEWEPKTSIGFVYTDSTNSDYCEITGSFEDLVGDVYVGVYYNEKRILGIRADSFINRDGITYVHMLDGIISIGDRAFGDCDALVSVDLPGTLAKLGAGAFKSCDALEAVVLPDTLTTLGVEAFADCVSLESVTLSKTLTEIPAGAFRGCTSLKEIVIPASVATIAENAFEGCTSLEKITFEVEQIIPEEETEEEAEKTEKGEKAEKEEVEEKGEIEETEITYVGLLTIKTGAFKNCTSLVEVILPITLESIEPLAFDNADLVIRTPAAENEAPEGWEENWHGAATVEWEYVPEIPEEVPEEETEEEPQKNGWLS